MAYVFKRTSPPGRPYTGPREHRLCALLAAPRLLQTTLPRMLRSRKIRGNTVPVSKEGKDANLRGSKKLTLAETLGSADRSQGVVSCRPREGREQGNGTVQNVSKGSTARNCSTDRTLLEDAVLAKDECSRVLGVEVAKAPSGCIPLQTGLLCTDGAGGVIGSVTEEDVVKGDVEISGRRGKGSARGVRGTRAGRRGQPHTDPVATGAVARGAMQRKASETSSGRPSGNADNAETHVDEAASTFEEAMRMNRVEEGLGGCLDGIRDAAPFGTQESGVGVNGPDCDPTLAAVSPGQLSATTEGRGGSAMQRQRAGRRKGTRAVTTQLGQKEKGMKMLAVCHGCVQENCVASGNSGGGSCSAIVPKSPAKRQPAAVKVHGSPAKRACG
jgi:hypothetical protein